MNDIEKIFNTMAEKADSDSPTVKIVRGFKNWVADMKMQGKLVNPERRDMKDWIRKNHPQHATSHTALWKEYSS